MIGHSIGEYVAACLAGVFSLEDGLALVAERGRLMQAGPARVDGRGLRCPRRSSDAVPRRRARSRGSQRGEPHRRVSGRPRAVEELEARLAENGVSFQRLHTSHAFHSRMMDGIVDAFAEQVARLRSRPRGSRTCPTSPASWITAAEATSPEYWAQPSAPAGAVRRAACGRWSPIPAASCSRSGPGQTLCSFARRHPGPPDAQLVVASAASPAGGSTPTPR